MNHPINKNHVDQSKPHVEAVINLLVAIFIIAFLTLVLVSPTG